MYVVFGGEYSDWYMVGYFDNLEEAQKYCSCDKNKAKEYYIEHSEKLSISNELKMKKLYRLQDITFDYKEDGTFKMRTKNPWYDYSIKEYTKKDEKQIYQNYNSIKWINYKIACDNRVKAEKIAQDRMTKLMYEMTQTDLESAAELLGYTNHQDRYRNLR